LEALFTRGSRACRALGKYCFVQMSSSTFSRGVFLYEVFECPGWGVRYTSQCDGYCYKNRRCCGGPFYPPPPHMHNV
jgi:hypothetical protein